MTGTPPHGSTAAIKRLFARWIGTPWWNFRFNLGYRIGGFTHARRDYGDGEL